MDQGE
jgi:hypothetical protein